MARTADGEIRVMIRSGLACMAFAFGAIAASVTVASQPLNGSESSRIAQLALARPAAPPAAQSAEETARLATDDRLRPEGLVSFGLGGPEIGVARPQFKPYFDRALAIGLHSVPHAGETTGPETVWDALTSLRAERIGHGTSAVRDPRLLEHLAENRIPLEVCPTSNVATRAVENLESHPITEMVKAGVLVTVNSDDPPMFGTDLNNEYAIAARLRARGFSVEIIGDARIAGKSEAAIESAFIAAFGPLDGIEVARH